MRIKGPISLLIFLFLNLASVSGAKDYSLACKDLLGAAQREYQSLLSGLNYLELSAADPKTLYEDLYYYPYPYLEMPEPVKAKDKPDTVTISKIHFMQRTVNFKSRDSKGGHEVVQNAIDLKIGKLSVDDLPRIIVWQDKTGKIWTLNHRRLVAMLLSGAVDEVPVTWAKPSEVLTDGNMSKYWPIKKGRRVRIIDYKRGVDILLGHK